MTVESSVQDVTYEMDGVTLAFPIPFYFLDTAHVYADFIDSAENLTSLVNGTDFTVTGAGDEDGGTLTLALAKAAPYNLHIYRDVPVTQETAYQQNSAFPAKTTETALDKLTMIAQQNASAVENSIRYPLNEYGTDGTLPNKTERADTVLGFDSAGSQAQYPLPASVGAGDLRIEDWTAAVDFVAGTSNSVPLSRNYTTKANLGTVVMDSVPQDPNSYSIDDGSLIFNQPIPDHISRIWCIGGTSLSLGKAASGSVGADQFAYPIAGATTDRPSDAPNGWQFLDTSLGDGNGLPITRSSLSSTGWVNSTGYPV
ncbi:hypothetical protein [Paraburkholderia sp. Ac-20347]|uniref:hypothetical protein n=1 Tax=Paraburkholderia sp. Ac-20347 TaxID=2703892 RepID=UPI00198167A3|nr:hypothetical protein [Paraburkholderia sp. Ac-20347]MBN3812227.1 hypothetical protein [Paraburkholderia sp. Ac-20347]